MKLTRPILFFDLETTGINVQKDRIVEIATVKIKTDGTKEVHSRRINPTIPIPQEASEVHGITDEMVQHEKTFAEIAPQLFSYFEGCDLGGFNILTFDLPFTIEADPDSIIKKAKSKKIEETEQTEETPVQKDENLFEKKESIDDVLGMLGGNKKEEEEMPVDSNEVENPQNEIPEEGEN